MVRDSEKERGRDEKQEVEVHPLMDTLSQLGLMAVLVMPGISAPSTHISYFAHHMTVGLPDNGHARLLPHPSKHSHTKSHFFHILLTTWLLARRQQPNCLLPQPSKYSHT